MLASGGENGTQRVFHRWCAGSVKHAGFVVNTGNATASDVIGLYVIFKKAREEHGVELETEIRIIGPID